MGYCTLIHTEKYIVFYCKFWEMYLFVCLFVCSVGNLEAVLSFASQAEMLSKAAKAYLATGHSKF